MQSQKTVKETQILALPDSEFSHQILKSLKPGTIFVFLEVTQVSGLKSIFEKFVNKDKAKGCK